MHARYTTSITTRLTGPIEPRIPLSRGGRISRDQKPKWIPAKDDGIGSHRVDEDGLLVLH